LLIVYRMDWIVAVIGVVVGTPLAAVLVYRFSRKDADRRVDEARAQAAATVHAARLDADALRLNEEARAREAALELRTTAEIEVSRVSEDLVRREERLGKRRIALEEVQQRIAELSATQKLRDAAAQERSDRARALRSEAQSLRDSARGALEKVAGATGAMVRQELAQGWIEEARAEAQNEVRLIEQNIADPEWGRSAKRIMAIAMARYEGHYLTERLLSNVALLPGIAEKLTENESALLRSIEAGSGVKLEMGEKGERLRIDSGDGVAREIARRALSRIMKGAGPKSEAQKWVEQIGIHLDREIMDLGRKAFSELEIPKAHPDIVKLVGRLNYRTSYTQNQWKHALEAAFLGGMMAAELGLDVKLARRATLMHDIGKALTHEIDGSHAVIGADIARRLGEVEIVANAIGAHHADEPPNSIYAYLVAAADAMSGARPGARREQTESFSTRVEDLERIGCSFRGVEEAVAVQGGREVRVYVRERDVNDLRAVELSTEIARKISAELTFPGQIKVTVIRSVEATEVAN
jgi:ribonucrease Y